MSSPKSASALRGLGQNLRGARLRRRISIADLALRAGTSASTIRRLEQGDPGVGIGTLCDILVVFGLVERLGELIDIRKDDLGLMLDSERMPRRGRSSATSRPSARRQKQSLTGEDNNSDTDGVAF